jgi:hypothetical protein
MRQRKAARQAHERLMSYEPTILLRVACEAERALANRAQGIASLTDGRTRTGQAAAYVNCFGARCRAYGGCSTVRDERGRGALV